MSERAKHSPGPWSFEAICFDQKIGIKGGVTAHGRPYTIAHVNRPGSAYADQDKANARLIAAAPDLVAALQAILGADTQTMHVGYDSSSGGGAYVYADVIRTDDEAFAKARTALSKALGQDGEQG
ncbi:hypothetical protein [Paraburkholderia fungorum]|uniref:hypothetical protein n=1 Tax=Paraburkholderia fungorum TaxID=134537 RepID=UPI003D6B8BBA